MSCVSFSTFGLSHVLQAVRARRHLINSKAKLLNRLPECVLMCMLQCIKPLVRCITVHLPWTSSWSSSAVSCLSFYGRSLQNLFCLFGNFMVHQQLRDFSSNVLQITWCRDWFCCARKVIGSRPGRAALLIVAGACIALPYLYTVWLEVHFLLIGRSFFSPSAVQQRPWKLCHFAWLVRSFQQADSCSD